MKTVLGIAVAAAFVFVLTFLDYTYYGALIPQGTPAAQNGTKRRVVYAVYIRYQNGDHELINTGDAHVYWISDSDCINIEGKRRCGVRHWNYINPKQPQ